MNHDYQDQPHFVGQADYLSRYKPRGQALRANPDYQDSPFAGQTGTWRNIYPAPLLGDQDSNLDYLDQNQASYR